ncbi:hypothetical protein LEN26_015152 [Aphanomyces euteiches]|uniref:Major facilitator superfamily (MFS) profile domain-containing protein n=2 Tax=Aphanomyces euteiches TaxID=100861 RepID=A0A6G0XRK1_9STRA|nr:hypothetical protein Ae201684_002045 [Aphanomyces euteiches]KAH9086672.1 hypothetical protein Ae201684P_000094 [Aphanomyces euteiches]KAH9103992.1 hypothetical protein LEN26_015152 [Aphanomyces euteiches]KAH9126551.1 hypothetical protein AeMF1_003037 [Aphanomyces euteiches]KAH9157021.1 hypothetical protein AeRB84_001124 [Aphanomyces euteiches]
MDTETLKHEVFEDTSAATSSIHIRKNGRRDSGDDETTLLTRQNSDDEIHKPAKMLDLESPREDGSDDTDKCAPPIATGSLLSRLVAWARKLRETFGLPFLFLVGMVYFVQGFNSFSSFALGYLIKDVMKLQPADSQAVMTSAGIPWGIKPLYGIMSDSLPIFGYRRKSYLVIMNMVGIAAFYGLYSLTPDSPIPFLMLILVGSSMATAVSDVIIDALVVERARLDPKNGATDLQSLTWCMMSFGGILGSLLAGPTTSHLGPNTVFLIASIGPITLFFLSCSMYEVKASVSERKSCLDTAREQIRLLCLALRVPVVWRAALFLFSATAISPSFGQIQFYFVTEELHFSEEFLGNMGALGFVFLMVGTITYNSFFKDVPFRTMFFFAHIGLALVSFAEVLLVTRRNLDLGIPDKWFVIGDAIISDIIGRMKTMPLLVLCAKLCPKGIEGTFFALLMSITNMAWTVSSLWGATLCTHLGIARNSYTNLWIAIVIRSAMKLAPIFFLGLLPLIDPQDEVDAMTTGSVSDLEMDDPVEGEEFLHDQTTSDEEAPDRRAL